MASDRTSEFYGGRFHEGNTREFDSNVYSVAFSSSDGNDHAAIHSVHLPDEHYPHDGQSPYEQSGQGTLFASSPRVHEVTDAYASEGARHQIPTLLGITAQRSLQQFGQIPGSSKNLSSTSARLVQNLVDRGVVKNPSGNGPTVRPINSMNRRQGAVSAADIAHTTAADGSPVPAGDIHRGRQFVREILRRPRERFTEVGEQMALIPKGKR